MSGQLRCLRIADPPEAWERLGFRVDGSAVELGGVQLALGADGDGIVGWAITGLEQPAQIDGLAIEPADPGPPSPAEPPRHPNGATAIDHVVLVTPDLDRTGAALERLGLPLRRLTETPQGVRQGFRRLGPAILELVQAPQAERPRLWGLTVSVEDIDALAVRLGRDLTAVKPAVQPGRRIATLRRSAGLSPAVAFMEPPIAAT